MIGYSDKCQDVCERGDLCNPESFEISFGSEVCDA